MCALTTCKNIEITVFVSLLYNAFFRRNALHAGGPTPSPLLLGGWRRLGCARLCGLGYLWNKGQVIGVSNDIDCDHQAQRYG